jgi:two-component system NtrC family response regulator
VDAAIAARGARLRVGKTTILLAGAETTAPHGARPSREEGLAELVGSSPAMLHAYERIRAAARSALPVLLTGETGVGKELAARAVHVLSDRARKRFVPINCAAIPRELIESELFGHVRGAFTGAVADHKGAFERAHGGTLFLDEIGELPLELQPKLLRILESGEVTPVGGGAAVETDARVIAASNRDLSRLTGAGRFRNDLYFRLAVLVITLPPLREHREDIPALVHHFLRTAARETGLPEAQRVRIDPGALPALAAHAWPGNVRELRSVLQRAALEARDGMITRELVETLLEAAPVSPSGQAGRSLQEIEREAILNCLKDCNHVRRVAARRLGIAESTLYEKIRRYGLEPSRGSLS